jgi:hypothetical protein
MVSPVDIANYALAAIGTSSQVTSLFPSDGSVEANLASILYDPVRKGLLRGTLWDFARSQIFLTQLKAATDTVTPPSTAIPAPWQYEYAYPANCLRVRKILPPFNPSTASASAVIPSGSTIAPPWPWSSRITYQVANDVPYATSISPAGQPIPPVKVILTNVQQAQMVYTLDVTDPSLFDSNFVDAFAHVLASRMCPSLTGDKQLALQLMKTAEEYVAVAKITDGDEGTLQQDVTPDWIKARGMVGSGWGLGGPELEGYWGYDLGGFWGWD